MMRIVLCLILVVSASCGLGDSVLDGRVTGVERVNAKTAFGPSSEKTWRGIAWRNERVHLPFVVWGPKKVDLRAESPVLCGPEGTRLPLSVSWVGEVLVDDRPHGEKVDPVKYQVYLSGDVLETAQPFRLTDAGYRAVWVSAKVPADARPGSYRGTLTVRNDRSSVVFPIELEVLAAVLPAKRKFHLDIWQTPWTIARYYGVKPFSPEHYAKMEPFLRELADAGQKAITTTITDYPWNVRENTDSARSMVRYVRRRDGTYSADFTVMDGYVAFAEKCGIGPQIHCYAPVKFERSNTYQYIDEATGEEKSVTLLPVTPEYEAYWGPLLTQLEAHARTMGWQDRLYIALDELPGEETAATAALIAKYAPSAKFHMAGNSTPESFRGIRIDGYSQQLGSGYMSDDFLAGLAERRKEGLFTTLYTCCLPFRPNALPMSPLYEQRWLGLYIAAKGFDGYLKSTFFRWTPGADPLKDAHCYPHFPCGDSYLVYPGPRWSLRWQSLVDGIEDCEKIRVLREAKASTPALEAALTDIDLGKNYSDAPSVRPDKAVSAALTALESASRAYSAGIRSVIH